MELCPMQIAQLKTIKSSAETRRVYAYYALERDYLNGVPGANAAFDKFLKGDMPRDEMIEWAHQEQKFRILRLNG